MKVHIAAHFNKQSQMSIEEFRGDDEEEDHEEPREDV
ncbi:hypothetical protein M2109_000806 [Paenibacillus sp. PastH-3]|jgi:hypothetical protein|nr:hypothetical protein [Paenibacillus sp. PastH-4]MDH6442795.1 hypothetical protein [Paenibacillus sp. PastF-4]MDH6526495.1 hypothetical protein [Paenibacillus sp. PastH-3]